MSSGEGENELCNVSGIELEHLEYARDVINWLIRFGTREIGKRTGANDNPTINQLYNAIRADQIGFQSRTPWGDTLFYNRIKSEGITVVPIGEDTSQNMRAIVTASVLEEFVLPVLDKWLKGFWFRGKLHYAKALIEICREQNISINPELLSKHWGYISFHDDEFCYAIYIEQHNVEVLFNTGDSRSVVAHTRHGERINH